MRSAFTAAIVVVALAGCSATAPRPTASASADEAVPTVGGGLASAGPETGGSRLPLGIDLVLVPSLHRPEQHARSTPRLDGPSVTPADPSAFHPPTAPTPATPLPAGPVDTTSAESVATFVALMWGNSDSLDPATVAGLSAWLTSEISLESRLPASPAGNVTVASAVASDLFDGGLTTRVVVTIEVADVGSGLVHLKAIDLLLEPTNASWIVTSLELAR